MRMVRAAAITASLRLRHQHIHRASCVVKLHKLVGINERNALLLLLDPILYSV